MNDDVGYVVFRQTLYKENKRIKCTLQVKSRFKHVKTVVLYYNGTATKRVNDTPQNSKSDETD